MSQLPRISLNHAGIWVAECEPMFEFCTRVMGVAVSDRAIRDNGDEIEFLTNDPNT
ncbi:MAG: hypothetical protein VW169_08805 [Rhodospirillaceae bacterium]|jgi:hypothetical protein